MPDDRDEWLDLQFQMLKGDARPRRNRGRVLIVGLIVIVCLAAAAFFLLHRMYQARLGDRASIPIVRLTAAPGAAGGGPIAPDVGCQIH